jgi:hypothetical protein
MNAAIKSAFRLRMRDFLTFRVSAVDSSKKYLHECKDSKSESGYSLLTYVDSTHSGLVNGNMRFYRPDLMAAGTHTWVDKNRPQKPILRMHDEDSDPLGRVATARYIDTKHEYTGKYAPINNLLFYDAVSQKRMDLFKSVDFVYNTLQKRNRDFQGLGYIQLGMNVTNPEAIAKVQREEYKTVSVGFKTDAAYCVICHQDWATDGRCEHRLGEMVDGQRMFLISGNFDYEECSFVTFPADPFAAVKSMEVIERAKDSMALRVFLLGQPYEEETGLLHHTDALPTAGSDLLESDIHWVSEDDEERTMDLEALKAAVNAKDLTKERALELRTELEGNKDAKRLLSSLNAKIRKNGWDADETDAAPTKEDVEARILAAADAFQALPEADRAAFVTRLEEEAQVYGLSVPSFAAPKTEDKAVEGSKEVDTLARELKLTDSDTGKTFVKLVESLHDKYKQLPDDEQYAAVRLIYMLYDRLGDEQTLEYLKARLAADPQQTAAIIDKTELDELHDAIESYQQSDKKFKASIQSLKDVNKTLVSDRKRDLASTIVMFEVLSGQLTADQVQQEIEERSTRQLVSLEDSLKDMRRKLAVANPALAIVKPAAATDAAVSEVRPKEVSDNVRVEDTVDQPAVTTDGEAQRGTDKPLCPRLTTLDMQALQRQAASDRYHSL